MEQKSTNIYIQNTSNEELNAEVFNSFENRNHKNPDGILIASSSIVTCYAEILTSTETDPFQCDKSIINIYKGHTEAKEIQMTIIHKSPITNTSIKYDVIYKQSDNNPTKYICDTSIKIDGYTGLYIVMPPKHTYGYSLIHKSTIIADMLITGNMDKIVRDVTTDQEKQYTKDEVIAIVAKFAKSYNTEKMALENMTLEECMEDVKGLIEFT